MKRLRQFIISLVFLTGVQLASAQGLGDLLKGIGGGGNVGDVIGNVIEGVFTKTNLSIEDLVGEYESTGPAVTFKSENLLQKAGGIAGAATIESKLSPYYEKYGLTGMTLSIDKDANYTMKIKGIKLSGVVTKNDSEGTFEFNFKVVGMNIGKFTAYVEKSGSTLKLMFDASKLKDFISAVAKFTGNSMAKALGTILDSYDGACIGFKMVSTGNSKTSTTSSDSGDPATGNSGTGSGLGVLKDILTKGK